MESTSIRSRLRDVLFVAALASAAPLAAAGPANVPFSATLITQELLHIDPQSCPTAPYLGGTTLGTGLATHMGAVVGNGSDCITQTSPAMTSFSNGKLTLVAANGDEVRAEYSGHLVGTATPPIFSVVGTYRFTGGTGRFENVSGGGTLGGLENLLTGQGQLKLSGTISY